MLYGRQLKTQFKSSNMKHAIWYENSFGRNDGSPLYYFNVLKNQMKLDIKHLAPHGETSQFGKFD